MNGSAGLRCSFCGVSQQEACKLIAGPSHTICDGCVARFLEEPSRDLPVAPPPGPCSFCGKRRDEVGSLLGARLEPAVCICDECLALCQEILAEQDTGDRPSSSGGQMLAAQRWVQIGGQQVEIAIQIPQEALGGSWSCGWSLQGPDWYEQQTAYGADSLEALERALQAVRERQAAIAWPGGKDEDGGASPPGGSTGSR